MSNRGNVSTLDKYDDLATSSPIVYSPSKRTIDMNEAEASVWKELVKFQKSSIQTTTLRQKTGFRF